MEGFPERLADAAKASGMTAAQIGAVIGRDRKAIYHYTHGVCSPDAVVLAKMCKLFKVSADWLLFGENE